MKTHALKKLMTKPQQGTALLPTLMIIGMVTAVIVLFFNLVTIQSRNAASQVASNDLTSLRDTAINSVIGVLRQGTTEENALWISQPGALRTYAAASGVPSYVYKLYSARDMIVTDASLGSAAQKNLEHDVPANWQDSPAIYGDLNEPTFDVTTGKISFPIIDPRVMDNSGTLTPEGFSYQGAMAAQGTAVEGVILPSSDPSSQRLPMPVRWIYVLQDGSMGVMGEGASPTFIPFSGNNNATVDNPIVGRIAYWTDDETSKININTASEALFWDTPRCVTMQEVDFASNPPVRNEVQRFGGHPATTCLSTVFFPGERLIPGQGSSSDKLAKIYDLVPRVNFRSTSATTGGDAAGLLGGNKSPVAYDNDRLYASVDELLLDSPSGSEATAQRQINELFDGDVERAKRLRFFLTAESRAPETTASGTPRVSLWPVHYDFSKPKKRTSFDNVSAFCSTLGSEIGKIQPFHFRRNSPLTNEGEFTNDSEFSVQAAEDPWKIGTVGNGNLATYVLEQARTRRQGYSKSMAEKYDSIYGAPQSNPHNIGTAIMGMMEYMRQTNLHDTTTSTSGQPVDAYGTNSGFIGSDISGQVTSIQINRYPPAFVNGNFVLRRATNQLFTNGTGREYTVSEFGLVFSVAAENPFAGAPFNPDLVTKLKLPKGVKAIQVTPVFEAFCPAQGYTMIAPSSTAQVTGLERLRITSNDLGVRKPGGEVVSPITFTQATGNDIDTNAWSKYGNMGVSIAHLAYLAGANPPATTPAKQSTGTWWIGWGGSGGRWIYNDNNSTGASDVATGVIDFEGYNFPNQYSRGFFLVSSFDTTMKVSLDDTRSNNIKNTLEIRIGNQRNGDFAGHRLYVEVPANGFDVPVPLKPTGSLNPGTTKPTMGQRLAAAQGSPPNRYRDATTKAGGPFGSEVPNLNAAENVYQNDVVRTWVVRHGDYRLCYIRQTEGTDLPSSQRLFVPHPGWWNSENGTAVAAAKTQVKVHSFTKSGGEWETGATLGQRNLVENETYTAKVRPDFVVSPASPVFSANIPNDYPYSVDPHRTRDWDNGTGIAPDGAYWNKPDDIARQPDGSTPPYFQTRNWDGVTGPNQTTAPNQLIPSAVMFGSIPSAASTGLQWTTFLFRPDITPGGHLGSKDHSTTGSMSGAPPDSVLLDWFWMPVVQPYAISEPFSTAGKINMNYRIAPFTYIKRATGLHAVLKSEQILAIPSQASPFYKDFSKLGSNGSTTIAGKSGWRHFIDADNTLIQWEDKFDSGEFFMNAGEICEQFLVPEGEGTNSTSAAQLRSVMMDFWSDHALTGDNTLERPYANIYPRLTTRSNTYRIHYKVQTITKARSSSPDTFDQNVDSITGELQGDAVVERSIDPNDASLTSANFNYIGKAVSGTYSSVESLDKLYSWRIRQMRRFSR